MELNTAQFAEVTGINQSERIGLRPRRLLIVVNDLRFFISHRFSIATRAQKMGFEVIVATPPPAVSVGRLIEQGIKHRTIKLDCWSMNPVKELRTIIDLCKLYRDVKPDVVHHVTIKPVIYGTIAARIASVPSVANAISGLGYMFSGKGRCGALRSRFAEVMYRLALKHPNQITIFQNRHDHSLFKDRILSSAEKTVIIPGSGVDLTAFTPVRRSPEVPVVMMVSRLLYDKGVEDFVEAARRVRAKGDKIRFVLVGSAVPDNPDGVEIGILQRWEREGAVELWGYQDDIYSCLTKASIICLPTAYQEGLPRILLEASACALPIITTPVAGCLEVIKDGFNGIIVPKRDAATLGSAIEHLLADKELRRSLGANARQRLEDGGFTVKGVADQTLDAYRVVLDGKLSIQNRV